MEALYKHIEACIARSGYKEPVKGETIYEEICEEIEDKEEGSYIFMCKKTQNTFFEYKIDVLADEFNLDYLVIHTPVAKYQVTFDA